MVRRLKTERRFDTIVVGGGPAGAVMAWALARKGVRVLVLDRAKFPREKVCGDFVEPRGLRILQTMGCMGALEASSPLAITHVNLLLNGTTAYRDRIPFYANDSDLPQHGYIIPREALDQRILNVAVAAGAELREECQVTGVERGDGEMVVHYRYGSGVASVKALTVVGADGTHSTVARSFDLLVDDPRYMAVSQRAYVEGIDVTDGEAAFVFDRDLFPGYGWMFPMSGGRANVGVGLLAETRDRNKISVPHLLAAFLDKLRLQHPGCRSMRLASRPIGGIVKTYGGHGPNRFDGGILIGDAGCFVDPMTGEGITPAAESALLGAPVIIQALERGTTDVAAFAAYQRRFQDYFDPAMRYLDFVACVMRNPHFGPYWLAVVSRGCDMAMRDKTFARLSGAAFGGLDVRPVDIVSRMWMKSSALLLADWELTARSLMSGKLSNSTLLDDVGRWHSAWWGSLAEDPAWHARWLADVGRKWLKLASTTRRQDPRAQSAVHLRLTELQPSGAKIQMTA